MQDVDDVDDGKDGTNGNAHATGDEDEDNDEEEDEEEDDDEAEADGETFLPPIAMSANNRSVRRRASKKGWTHYTFTTPSRTDEVARRSGERSKSTASLN